MLDKIRKSNLFKGVDSALLSESIPAFRELNRARGGVIFHQGTRGDALFLIISGRVSIVTHPSSSEKSTLATLTAGQVIGELDIIDNGRRSSDAVALTKCRLLRIPRKDFLKLLKKSPELGKNLLVTVAGRLRQSNLSNEIREQAAKSAAQTQIRRLESLNDAAYLVHSSLNLRTLLSIILDTAAELVKAGRGTLYLVDEEKSELWSHVNAGSGSMEIRLALGEGLAGYVARTGEIVNLQDAYADPRFNPNVDRVSGFVSRTMLCVPLRNQKGKTIGVLQLLNKSTGSFDKEDETYIEALCVHAAHALENARLAERMIHEERLSAVGRMAGAIVHDIKNPLTVLRFSAEILARKSTNPEVAKITAIMIDQIDRFDSMAQEIIEFSKGTSSLKIRAVNAEKVVQTVTDIYASELKRRGITLKNKVGHRGKIQVDFDKIVRCVQNIVGNAIDALPRGGTLKISTARQGPFFKIEIADNGPGIPKEIKSKIFEPFVTHGKKNGTGLGLPIVKKIVEDHRGKVEAESEPGKGTRIRITLPVKQPA